MRFRLCLLGVVLIACLVTVGAVALIQGPRARADMFRSTNTCQEGEACWDWRTMGDHQRGVCQVVNNHSFDMLEQGDGTLSPGGRGCEGEMAENAAIYCERTIRVVASQLPMPSGWSVTCGTENLRLQGAPVNGLTTPIGNVDSKSRAHAGKVEINAPCPNQSTGHSCQTPAHFEGVVAHEICHARLMSTGDMSQWSTSYMVVERAADACSLKAGYRTERSVTEGF